MFSSSRSSQDRCERACLEESVLIGQQTGDGQGPSSSTSDYVWQPPGDYSTVPGDYKQKDYYERPFSGPLTKRERVLLRVYDVNDRLKFLTQRKKQIGATTVRDALGFAFNLTPNQVFRQTAGIDKTSDLDVNTLRNFDYGNFVEPVAKRYHDAKLPVDVKYGGFRANPAFNPSDLSSDYLLTQDREMQKNMWFAENWPFLFRDALSQAEEDVSNFDFVTKRDNIINAHWLVTSPDGMVDTSCLFSISNPTPEQQKMRDIHNSDSFGYQGICEVKSKINQFNAQPSFLEGYVIQMAAQALCCMEDQEYETGSLIPWGHLIMMWVNSPLAREEKSSVEPNAEAIIQSWFLPFVNPNFFLEMMDDMRRFKESLDRSYRQLEGFPEQARAEFSTVEFNLDQGKKELYQEFAREVLSYSRLLYRETPNKNYLKFLNNLGEYTAC